MLTTILICIGLGVVAGFLAGLLGIGGGVVIVPMLTFTFAGLGFPHEHILHLALGTSLATIVFTSMSSMRAHHKRGAVNWFAFKLLAPGIIIGTFLGAGLASLLSTNFLKVFFGLFLYWVSADMLFGLKPKGGRKLPGIVGMFFSGNIIGVLSSLVGIGGGSLCVPFLTWCNLTIHNAIGTAAAVGLPLAISGAAGYIYYGFGAQNLPEYSFGFVYLPAFLGIICTSVLVAPFGAKTAHNLPVTKLKKIFAVLLFLVGTRMLWTSAGQYLSQLFS